jgi:hypothetical protein
MRRPARSKGARSQVSSTYSVPAPVKGWNARDSIATMRAGDAVVLKNFFPLSSDVALRSGHEDYVTVNEPAQVETLASYRPMTGAHKLFAFVGTKIFDASAAGALTSPAVTGLTSARWQTTNFTTIGGNFLLAVNGSDNMRLYDGSSWTAVTGVSTPSITGVTTSQLVHVNVFKERVWYTQANTLDVWYSAAGAFAGALTKFSLASIFKKGGYLVAMGSWTIDGGSGVDDLAVFITSQGEVAVYQGTNPASASTWALVGIYNLAPPLGRRCMLKYGGDLLLLTQDGIVPASQALIDSRRSHSTAVSDKISGAIGDATSLYGSNFGWEMSLYPNGGSLILNVPKAVGMQEQYVMNTTTNAWAQFTGWTANCFEVHNDQLYFGSNAAVHRAWKGTSDRGTNIVAEMVGAFDYFGSRDGLKSIKMMRPVIGWDANPAEFLLGVDVDFVISTPTGAISFAGATGAVWDSSLWDVALWAGDIGLNKIWYSAFGLGYAIAPHLKISSSKASVRVAAFDYVFERGGVL